MPRPRAAQQLPVDANVKIDKGGQIVKKTAFYIRIGNGTREIADPAEKQKYLTSRWGAANPESAE
ncbi:MAG: hypothetical protein H0W06_11830 [Chloroflexia bacterium]|nr:hypothetical protein [Chloroflexia bacterium]